MSVVTVELTAAELQDQVFPAGTTTGPIRVSWEPGAGQAAVAPQDLPGAGKLTFTVDVGAWTVVLQRLDGGNNPLGAAFRAPLTVAAPTVTISIPIGALITQVS